MRPPVAFIAGMLLSLLADEVDGTRVPLPAPAPAVVGRGRPPVPALEAETTGMDDEDDGATDIDRETLWPLRAAAVGGGGAGMDEMDDDAGNGRPVGLEGEDDFGR